MARPRPAGSLALRPLLALGVSLGLHVGLTGVMLGTAVWRGWQLTKTVEIELVSTQTKDVQQLPFGPPPPPPGQEAAPARRPKRVAAADQGVHIAADGGTADAGAPADGGADAGTDASGDGRGDGGADGRGPHRRDLRQYGPEGSRLTAILRLDRLRDSPDAPQTTAAVDRLLMNLPDRRRLLEGTSLDLYRDFDVILIATPNPMDDAVTFLAARHHLSDERLMDELAKGAEAAGRPITWRTQGGRPVGLRRARRPRGAGEEEGPPQLERDDRILVLPQPGLAIMAPPAYAGLLIPGKGAARRPDGGAAPAAEARWSELIARIDAEGGAMPDDAILMMTAANLTGRPARGADPDAPEITAPGGLRLPEFATVVVGTTPLPFLQADGEFSRAADARAWQNQWPKLRQQLLASPILLLSGFSGIVSGAEVSRDGPTLTVRTTASPIQLRQILMFIANLLPGARRP